MATVENELLQLEHRLLAGILREASGLGGREVIPRTFHPANPAAGADWSFTVPGGAMWIVMGYTAKLTADANVATRGVRITVDDGIGVVAGISSAEVLTAGIAHTFMASRGVTAYESSSGSGQQGYPCPTCPLLAGWKIGSSTANIQVGDQWSAIGFYVLEVEETAPSVETRRDAEQVLSAVGNPYYSLRSFI